MRIINKLVLITTALRLEDGGAASLSRLVAVAMNDYSKKNNIGLEILDLGKRADVIQGINIRYFDGHQLELAFAIWRRILRSRKTAFVFTHIGPARAVGIIPKFLLPRYIIWMLGVEMWQPHNFEQRRAIKNATLRVSISSFTERVTRGYHPWLPPTEILPIALEDQPISSQIDDNVLRKVGEDFILIVGRMASSERYKGHDELLQVMPTVLQKCPDARLVITGKGDDLSRLQSVADNLGIRNRVIFTGFVSDATLYQLYQRCQIFAMPSRREGFGLVFLEAMKASRPCVALRDSAAAEIIENGITGILVDNNDPRQLTNALVRLLQDDTYSEELGVAGYNRWRDYFTRDAFYSRFHKCLDQLCQNKV